VRLRVVSLRKIAEALETPFTPEPLLVLGEYTLALFRCEGCGELYRNMDSDELFWPQDRAMKVSGEVGPMTIQAGELLCIPQGWKHATEAEEISFVLSVNRTDHVISRNGYHAPRPPAPPRSANPETLLDSVASHKHCFLLQCNDLYFYAQRLAGATPARSSGQGAWIIPLSGVVGVRCGGMVTTLKPTEIVQVPAHSNWHLFGKADVVWATLEPLPILDP
jgi:hypothetical protein